MSGLSASSHGKKRWMGRIDPATLITFLSARQRSSEPVHPACGVPAAVQSNRFCSRSLS